jgi:streptogramin lyase
VTGRRTLVAAALAFCAVLPFLWPVLPATASEPHETTLIHPPFGHCLGITRVTSFHLFLHLGGRTRFDEPAGIHAVKLRSKDDPSTPHDDDELTVFGLNSGRSELIYNTSLYAADIYGSHGSGPGRFSNPLDVTADERGNVFVSDTGNDRVVRLAYESDTLRYVRSFGSTGGGERQLRRPSGIALGHSGRLYVADTGNDRIVVMSGTGDPVATIPAERDRTTDLERPFGLDVAESGDRWLAGRRTVIAVSDRDGERLSVFDGDGTRTAMVEAGRLPVSGASFGHVAIDYYGNVYAVDRNMGAIHKFDADLDYVTTFGRQGRGENEFDEPRGITIWRRFGQVFVTERAGAQYYWIGTDILGLEVAPERLVPGRPLRIEYVLTEVSRVTIELVDAGGEIVHTLLSNRRRAVGTTIDRWAGRMEGRPPPPPGEYTVRVSARPTYSSGQYFEDVAIAQLRIEQPAPEP